MNNGPWTQFFRKSSMGPGVYALRGADTSAADRVEKTLRTAGLEIAERNTYREPVLHAAALPGGAMFRVVHGFGFGGMPMRLWVIGARPLRHVLRLLAVDQPVRRLSGEEGALPRIEELEAEWARFVARPAAEQIRASEPWLLLEGSANLETIRAAAE
ncbi:hypothetical protein [Paractinoplanes lichenicola]|uniref:Uncharacterized protein n=1 Tax=Paractinoplanes lichenicola TaxID=2802976 RepID=A0ABS1W5R9_9ACTN|nr:hypothetical protein [Actinoplanes lichenicola]MBL7262079.1 hypothetical protein [Actinoplanes lichenicola]